METCVKPEVGEFQPPPPPLPPPKEDMMKGVSCVLCCTHLPQPTSDYAGGFQLTSFAGEVLQEYLSSDKVGDTLQTLSVCKKCLRRVDDALHRKWELKEAEVKVRELQRQLLHEMKGMYEKVKGFWKEMHGLGKVVDQSGEQYVELYVQNVNVALDVRNAISSVVNDLEEFRDSTESKLNAVQKMETKDEEEDLNHKSPSKPESTCDTIQLKRKHSNGDLPKSKHDRPSPPDYLDTSDWSPFKGKLHAYVVRKLRNRDKALENPPPRGISDPRLQHCLEYNRDTDTFSVGDITVIPHEDTESLECSACGEKVTKIPDSKLNIGTLIKQHVQLKHLNTFQCQECDTVLESFQRYRSHVSSHRQRFQCSDCDKSLSTEETLRAHRWKKHLTPEQIAEALAAGETDPRPPDKNLLKCGMGCGATFKMRKHLKKHLKKRCPAKTDPPVVQTEEQG